MRSRVTLPAAAIAIATVALIAPVAQAAAPIDWTPLGTYSTGLGNASGETSAYERGRLYVTNTTGNSLDIVDARDPRSPSRTARVDLAPYGGGPNSVAVDRRLVAVAVEATTKTDKGDVVFFSDTGRFLGKVQVGALPDMVTFTPDGRNVLIANEGEPNSYNQSSSVDPVGSIAVIPTKRFRSALNDGGTATGVDATIIGFGDFNVGGPRNGELPAKLRLNGPGASVAQDLEPEYITVSQSSRTAWVTLQEANAIAIVDLKDLRVESIEWLGTKDHDLAGNGLDPSDRDSAIAIATWPVHGLYMPDAVATVKVRGERYLVTANEGDGRDYTGFGDEARISSLTLDPTAFPNAAALKANAALGRLNVSRTDGTGPDGYTKLFSYGARSLSVWSTDVELVGDTGDQIERTVAAEQPANFNGTHDANDFDTRSDNKGPEPEGVDTGVIRGRPYAFVGLERIGGFMTVDLSDPTDPQVVDWANNRDYSANPVGTDSGPEIIHFVDGDDAPRGRPMVIVANEISGTVTFYGLVRGPGGDDD